MHVALYILSAIFGSLGMFFFMAARSTFHEMTGMMSFLVAVVAFIGGAMLSKKEGQGSSHYHGPGVHNHYYDNQGLSDGHSSKYSNRRVAGKKRLELPPALRKENKEKSEDMDMDMDELMQYAEEGETIEADYVEKKEEKSKKKKNIKAPKRRTPLSRRFRR